MDSVMKMLSLEDHSVCALKCYCHNAYINNPNVLHGSQRWQASVCMIKMKFTVYAFHMKV